MFEQSLYDIEPVATPLEEGDLFHKYEIKQWDLGPRLYKIFGITAVCNILAILIIGQTSLLTTKTCDSPIVGSVCQVLDTVYVGALLFGTDREVVDAAYDKTVLADSDITFVDVSGETPPLSYPEGYFQVANPEEYQAMLAAQQAEPFPTATDFPGFPPPTPTRTNGGSLFDTKPKTPKHNNDVLDGDLPTGFGDSTATTTGKKPGNKKPPGTGKDVNDGDAPKPEPTPMSSDAVQAVEINKKPLTDFADGVVSKWAAKEVDLNQDFTVVLNGVLTKDGKLDAVKSKFDPTKQKGDPKMIEVAKAALAALGDSGYLTYLQVMGVEKVTVTLTQDDQQITAVVSSAQKTPERASSLASNISGVILIGKTVTKNPSDERTLLDGAKTTTDGKNFLLNFAMPKDIAQEMINRKLKEAQSKKALQPQPNSNALSKPIDNTAKK